jgi:hypothetical protein
MFPQKKDILVLQWRDKRVVCILSRLLRWKTLKQRKGKMKSLADVDYNKDKAVVDLWSVIIGHCSTTLKWWRKLSFHCIIIAISNDCILHNTSIGDALYALIRKNTLPTRVVGKTHPTHVLIAMLDYVSPLQNILQWHTTKTDSFCTVRSPDEETAF